MKKLVTIFLMFFFLASFGQKENLEIDLKQKNDPFVLTSSKSVSINVESKFSKISFLGKESKGGSFSEITIPGTYLSNNIGYPQLPQVKKLIEIPQDAKANVEIVRVPCRRYGLKNQVESTF